MWTQSTARLTVHETFCANCGFGSAAIRVVASDPIGTIRASRSCFDRERVRVVGESRQENKEERLIYTYLFSMVSSTDSPDGGILRKRDRRFSCNFPRFQRTTAAKRESNDRERERERELARRF